MKKLSVIIININNLNYTKNCINDLLNQTVKNFDITLVDQGSTEMGTNEYLNSLTGINIIRNNENISIHKLWNNFYNNGNESEYLCYLNNDVKLLNNYIKDTIDILDKDDTVGIVIHSSNSYKYNKKLDNLDYRFSERKVKQGWDFTIRKKLYKVIPTVLQFYYGDDWLFHYVYEQNYKVAVCISSPIIHYGCKSSQYSPVGYKEETETYKSLGLTHYLPHYNEYSEVLPTFKEFGDNPIEIFIYYDKVDNVKDVYFENENFIKLNQEIMDNCGFSISNPPSVSDLLNINQYWKDRVKIQVSIAIYNAIDKGYKKMGISDLLMKHLSPLYINYLPNYTK